MSAAHAIDDVDLVARALRGREDGFEQLVRRYQRPIVAYVYRMIGDYDLALDGTQEVFIKVYNSLDRYNSEYKFSTWIYRIAHNVAIDHLRRTSAHSASLHTIDSDGDELERPLADCDQASPEANIELSERRETIEAAVQTLPPAYRELILLRHAHDMSYDEIAEVTGLPLGTIKNRIFRARACVRERLVERGITSA